MKKTLILCLLALTAAHYSYAQKISFSSNGHVNHFTKIDTLFFTEYSGKRPALKSMNIDTSVSRSFMQFDSSFGFITKTTDEASNIGNKLIGLKKRFSSTFYAYTDGALQAPTSVLFFKPRKEASVRQDFFAYGTVEPHSVLKGYYYLYLRTDIYNNGDKVLALCDTLNSRGLTTIAEPVFVRRLKMSTDPLQPNEWNISNTGQYNGTVGADMKVTNVWSAGYTGNGIKVAVIDLGVDLTHPDLQANLLPGYDATGNGSAGGPQYDVYNTHGTNCAGIIAEIQNNIGGVGVAYNAKVIPIRLGIGTLDPSGVILTNSNDTWESNCFNYAVNNGADIISCSWGGYGSPSAQLDAAISNAVTNGRSGKGSVVLCAAGNDNLSTIIYPASNTNVIAVGASCECDTRKTPASCDGETWWGSNYGTGLDVIAPGVNITTTTFIPTIGGGHTDDYVANFNGTSAATPNTAAVVALILSINPNLTGQQARNILESSTDKVGGYNYQSNVSGQPNGTWSSDAGYGRVNACTAMGKALSTSGLWAINGDLTVCGTSNPYTISNLPPGASVTWSMNPSNVLSLSCTNCVSPTATTIASSPVYLFATVTVCGFSTTLTSQQIQSGNGFTGGYFVAGTYYPLVDEDAGTNYLPANNWYVIHATSTVSSTPTWTNVGGYGINGWQIDSYHDLNVNLQSGGYAAFQMQINTSCGVLTDIYIFQEQDAGSDFVVSPNPANSDVTVTVNSTGTKSTTTSNVSIQRIMILDKTGKVVFQNTYPSIKKVSFNIGSLPTDMYIVRIFDGKRWSTGKLMKQ